MYIEYFNNNIEYKDIDYKNELSIINKFPISSILGYPHYIKYIKKNYKYINCELGCFIDYPLGYNSIDYRIFVIKEAIDIGCNFIVMPIPFYTIINRKYEKFRNELLNILEICKDNKIHARYMLEYRKFDHQLLTKVCKILVDTTIDIVYPSTGFFIDNLDDHLIASKYLIDKANVKTIINTNIWKKDQINQLVKNNIYGISINNTACLNIINPQLYD